MASATEILTQIERQKAALHSKQIEATQAKLFEITAFQKVMNNQFNSVETKIRQITKVFDKSYYDRKTKKGILRQRSDLYADCFYVDLAKLRELFIADEEAWRKDLEKAKRKASNINDRAEGLLQEKQE